MKALLVLLVSAFTAAAASPAEIDALAVAARAVPPEFGADALLRLAALEQPAARRIELIRQAFEKGSHAQEPYKRRSILLPGQVSPFSNRAYQQELDALSLQLRAVEAMLGLDPAEARALLLRIPALRLKPLACSDGLAFDVDRLYRTLAAAAAQSFSAKQKTEGESLRFLEPYAIAIASPVQAGPMADAIAANQDGSDGDFQKLVAAYATALGKIHGDDRSFTWAYKVGSSIELLAAQCDRRKISALPLLESYRLYLVVHLSAARCADNDRVAAGADASGLVTGAEVMPSIVDYFNRKLRRDPLQPIQEIESTPARLEGVAAVRPACRDEACKTIAGRYRELIVGADGRPIPPATRTSPEWQSGLEAMLADLKKWTPGNSSPAGFFRDKAGLYNDLLNLAPAGAPREAVLRAEMEFLLGAKQQAAGRMEWFFPLNALLARTALDPAGYASFAEALRKSSDPVVALYARLEALAPRPPDRLIGLL
jgi:hypothetical protein